MTIGANIRMIRKKKGLTIRQLSEKSGVSRSAIGDIETDKNSPSAETLERLAGALDVSASVFFKTQPFSPSIWDNIADQNVEFCTAEEAMAFILRQPAIAGFGGFDINKLSEDELIDFANELLGQLKLLGYKYHK